MSKSLRVLAIMENISQLSLDELNMVTMCVHDEHQRHWKMKTDRINRIDDDIRNLIWNTPESKNVPIRLILPDIGYYAVMIFFTQNHCLMFYTTGAFSITNSDTNGQALDENLISYTETGVLSCHTGDANWISESQSAIQLGFALQSNRQPIADWIHELDLLVRRKPVFSS